MRQYGNNLDPGVPISPRSPLSRSVPGIITADAIARWSGLTTAAVRLAAARGRIPKPTRVQHRSTTGRTVTVNAWSEADRDAIIVWALKAARRSPRGLEPHLPAHLIPRFFEPGSDRLRRLREAVERDVDAVVQVLPIGPGSDCLLLREIRAQETELIPDSRLGLASLPAGSSLDALLTRRGAAAAALEKLVDGREDHAACRRHLKEYPIQYTDLYVLMGAGPGDQSARYIPAPCNEWPFSTAFSDVEVAEVLGAFPVAGHGLNPRALQIPILSMQATRLVHPAFVGAQEARVEQIHTLRAVHGPQEHPAGILAAAALAPLSLHNEGFAPAFAEPACTVLGVRPITEDELEQARSAPARATVSLSSAQLHQVPLEVARAAAALWGIRGGQEQEHRELADTLARAWELDLDAEADAALLQHAQEGDQIPFWMLAVLSDRGRAMDQDYAADTAAFTASGAGGDQLQIISFQGRCMALAPSTATARPLEEIVSVELPRRRGEGPAMVRYADGSVWPLPLGRSLSHQAGHLGQTSLGLVRAMAALMGTAAGQRIDPDAFDASDAQVRAMNAISVTSWTREQIVQILGT